ncbi:acyl-CoA transferase [Xylophilus sp. Kf1]|nr:acyl-CoA transferase [Xylophilus sp. Kf1]
MNAACTHLTKALWSDVDGDPAAAGAVSFTGTGALPSAFRVTDFAAACMAAAGLAIAELDALLVGGSVGGIAPLSVDRRLASFWFGLSIRPVGWQLPPAWDSIAGDYRTRDGWLRLHTNAPHHRVAAERVLGIAAGGPATTTASAADAASDRAVVAAAVAGWDREALETAVVGAGGCAAAMRSAEEWACHPQGLALAGEPLVQRTVSQPAAVRTWRPRPGRPLAGLRVLDLTRVLAGPVGSRLLAGYGADVLRIDPPGWDEPALVPEVTLGKRCARLDLKSAAGRATLESLLSSADVLLHGYRPDALEGLGLGLAWRRQVAPGLVEVCHDAYGWSGPWASRRGFDSLVQMSCGIAHAGMAAAGADRPTPLPVQALDHGTGYLVAAAAVRGLTERLKTGQGSRSRLSLARTAESLMGLDAPHDTPPLVLQARADVSPGVEATDWGPAQRLAWPIAIEGIGVRWDLPARALGWAPARWA